MVGSCLVGKEIFVHKKVDECKKTSVCSQYFELERPIYLRFVEVNDYEYD